MITLINMKLQKSVHGQIGLKRVKRPTRIFFHLEEKRGQEKLWNWVKCSDNTYKYDIDSLPREKLKFYSNSFKTEGWSENHGQLLTRLIERRLSEKDKTYLDIVVSFDEVEKVLKSLKTNKFPGEDGIISEFYYTGML